MSDGSSTCAVHVEVRAGTGDGQNCRGESLDASKMGKPEVTITEIHRLVR